jgi:hypothetical protein
MKASRFLYSTHYRVPALTVRAHFPINENTAAGAVAFDVGNTGVGLNQDGSVEVELSL